MKTQFCAGARLRTAVTLSLLAIAVSFANNAKAQSGTLTVAGTSVLEGAGRTGSSALAADGSGTAAPTIALTSGAGSILTFSSIAGSVTYNGGGNFNDPDGVGNPNTTNISSYQGISGFAFNGRAGYLLGVFISGAPTGFADGSSGSNASSFSYSSAADAGFASLSPTLDQAFFIGDGLTGDGTGATQQFVVPAGATSLVLGFEDAGGYNGNPGSYGDNSGSFTASYNISGSASAPEPSSVVLLALPATGLVAWSRRRKQARPAA